MLVSKVIDPFEAKKLDPFVIGSEELRSLGAIAMFVEPFNSCDCCGHFVGLYVIKLVIKCP